MGDGRENTGFDSQCSDLFREIRAVKVPYESNVEQGDIFLIEGKQYKVVQKDLKDDRQPLSWLLSLALSMVEFRMKKEN